jgi:hypothetical protein
MPFLETLAQFNCTPFSHGGFGFSSGFGGHGVWLGGMHFPFGWIGIALLIGAASPRKCGPHPARWTCFSAGMLPATSTEKNISVGARTSPIDFSSSLPDLLDAAVLPLRPRRPALKPAARNAITFRAVCFPRKRTTPFKKLFAPGSAPR